MKPHRRALLWFRRDLRLTDHPALQYCLENAEEIIPVYIHAPQDEGEWPAGAASRWWLHHSLDALEAALRRRGARLVIRSGRLLATLEALLTETGADLLACTRSYEPSALQQEAQLASRLAARDVEFATCDGTLLSEPRTVRNQQGQPYKVFTAFWRAIGRELEYVGAPAPAPARIPSRSHSPSSLALSDLQLLPQVRWDEGLAATWRPGEAGALEQLETFAEQLGAYGEGRDRPDRAATSRLSPHLHFGELSPRQVLTSVRPHGELGGAFLRELGWREFAQHLLFHFPHTPEQPLDERFERLRWSNDAAAIERWRRGATGVPLVDAGMRELWRTGWMHNRVRMVAASFLTKNLQVNWLVGARWFWETLVDADLANNTLNWQWVAGCGADAAPYYRIFNPVLQAERFDPQRTYIRRWIPALARLPDRWIHQPWAAPATILAAAGVRLGETYPQPIVDLAASRKRALAAYEALRAPGS